MFSVSEDTVDEISSLALSTADVTASVSRKAS